MPNGRSIGRTPRKTVRDRSCQGTRAAQVVPRGARTPFAPCARSTRCTCYPGWREGGAKGPARPRRSRSRATKGSARGAREMSSGGLLSRSGNPTTLHSRDRMVCQAHYTCSASGPAREHWSACHPRSPRWMTVTGAMDRVCRPTCIACHARSQSVHRRGDQHDNRDCWTAQTSGVSRSPAIGRHRGRK